MMAFQNLAELPSGTEDAMETSEFDRDFDREEDIDIDLEFANDRLQPQPEPDQEMQEELDRPPELPRSIIFGSGGTDTLMEDDAYAERTSEADSVHDEVIQDAETEIVVPNEDVIEDDLEGNEENHDDQDLTLQMQGDIVEQYERNDTDEVLEHVDEDTRPGNASSHVDQETSSNAEQESHHNVNEGDPENSAIDPDREATPSDTLDEEAASVPTVKQEDVPEPNYDDGAGQENHEFVGRDHREEAIAQNSTLDLIQDELFEDKELEFLHPIYIYYQDEEDEIYLFEPRHQDRENTRTFLLGDQTLFYEAIEVMLHACRKVLKDNIGEDDELEMSVDGLDLKFSESTVINPSLTFASLLATFTQLHRNDGIDPPPLCVHLYTRPNFSRRWQQLCNEANEGKGYSAVQVVDKITLAETEAYHDGKDEVALENANNAIQDEVSNPQTINLQDTKAQNVLKEGQGSTDKDVEGTVDSTLDRENQRDVSSRLQERQDEDYAETSVQPSKFESGDAQAFNSLDKDDLYEEDDYDLADEVIDHADDNDNGNESPDSSADSSTLKGEDSMSAKEFLLEVSSEPSTKFDTMYPNGTKLSSDGLHADGDQSTGAVVNEDENKHPEDFRQIEFLKVEETQDDLFADNGVSTNDTDAVHGIKSLNSILKEVNNEIDANAEADILASESSDKIQQAPTSVHDPTDFSRRPDSEADVASSTVAEDGAFPLDEIEDPDEIYSTEQAREIKNETSLAGLKGDSTAFSSAEDHQNRTEDTVDYHTPSKSIHTSNIAEPLPETAQEASQEDGSHTQEDGSHTQEDLNRHDDLEPQHIAEREPSPSPGSLKRRRSKDAVDFAVNDLVQGENRSLQKTGHIM
ncbi:uncharacterized protein KY384_006523 [Bacidia gigantensis]|uniref:uncharacterized protein n=1 Tax=Bacidia gigantensis TaxID=2732470 RepID=UPI001D03B5FC|nr:uncharacterized protein KY384_006523 [Bacidia gigantensis]KAG8528834.1 hypothetical protein KY384_006523 [Bacidia gigantensis]